MSSLPAQCAIAFKEWTGVCRALAEGRQTILVRKGGIREQSGRFEPEHSAFWLYPTHVHEAQQGLRDETDGSAAGASSDPADRVFLDALACVELLAFVTSEDALTALEPFHVWTPKTIRRRFAYRHPGLWVMSVRVFLREEPWSLVPTDEQLGCKSWVALDAPLDTNGLQAVLDQPAAEERLAQLRALLAGQPGPDS
jgi:hypothetical protein